MRSWSKPKSREALQVCSVSTFLGSQTVEFSAGEPNTTLALSFLLSSRDIPSLLNGQKAQSQAVVGSGRRLVTLCTVSECKRTPRPSTLTVHLHPPLLNCIGDGTSHLHLKMPVERRDERKTHRDVKIWSAEASPPSDFERHNYSQDCDVSSNAVLQFRRPFHASTRSFAYVLCRINPPGLPHLSQERRHRLVNLLTWKKKTIS